jgi:hypothetical protein
VSQPLLDPQLEAFYGSDPANFLEDGYQPTPLPEGTPPHVAVAIELAVAFLVARGVAKRWLQAQDPRVGEVSGLANQAWEQHALPVWIRIAVPAISEAYTGLPSGLTKQELTDLATEYAQGLGEYLNSTSSESLLAGFTEQLNKKFDQGLSWHRAAEGYGLDKPTTRTYVAALDQAKPGPDLIPPNAQSVVDNGLLQRAENIGETEGWRSIQSGKALAWMMLQANGSISMSALREWDNTNELACPVCVALNGQQVGLTEPFVHPVTGERIWAPGAHPGCLCEVNLIEPAEDDEQADKHVEKAMGKDPYDRDREGRFAAAEARTRKPRVTLKEREHDPVVDDILDQVAALPKDAFGVVRQDLFAPAKQLFGEATGQLFGDPGQKQLFAAPEQKQLFDAPQLFSDRKRPTRRLEQAKTGAARRRVVHHVFVQHAQPGDVRSTSHEPFYMPVQYFHAAFESSVDQLWGPGDVVDFSEANESLKDMQSYWHDESADEDVALAAVQIGDPMKLDPDHREQPFAGEHLTEEFWSEVRPRLFAAHQQALSNVDDVVERLSTSDLQQIMNVAGYDPTEPSNSIRARIVRSVNGGVGSDSSLAGSYADHVAYEVPEVLGDFGLQLGRILEEVKHEDISIYYPEDSQFFSFENGFHEDAKHGKGYVDVHHTYLATHASYHSEIMEKGTDALPFVMGWREISLVPADSEGRKLPE